MKEDSDQRIAGKIFQFVDLEGLRVLEIGCGNGRITSLIEGKPKKLIAIEPDAEKIREARKKVAGVEFRTGSGENLEFSDNHFDVVIFTLSLHHQNGKSALKEASRVLKESGTILIIEPKNEGEVERVFSFLRNEDQAILDAQKSINESGLIIEGSEVFEAQWIFENKDKLCQSVFKYYEMPFDNSIALQISGFLGAKVEANPIVLIDNMTIQSLKKVA